MMKMNPTSVDENFAHNLHKALRNLYEPYVQRGNPLVDALDLNRQGDVPAALRKILLDAIHALKPDSIVPSDSNAWRIYQVLSYRFEEQYSQDEVASQMAVSPRQVRRIEFTATRVLASYLVEHAIIHLRPTIPAPGEALPASLQPTELDQESEYTWLKKSYAPEVLTINKLIDSILEISASLLKPCKCQISVELTPEIPPVMGQLVTLRQAFLTLLLAAVRSGAQGVIHIGAHPCGRDVVIEVSAVVKEQPENKRLPGSDVSEYIQQARRLVELSKGFLELTSPGWSGQFTACVTLSHVEEVNILFIDDNEDSLRLFQRYLEGTRYQFIGTRDPQQALTLAAALHPRLILLDIMLPGIDGWELLGRLRHHPSLEKVPIIISTILPHEQLAAVLGASGFLRKPVSREQLLDLLRQKVEPAT